MVTEGGNNQSEDFLHGISVPYDGAPPRVVSNRASTTRSTRDKQKVTNENREVSVLVNELEKGRHGVRKLKRKTCNYGKDSMS